MAIVSLCFDQIDEMTPLVEVGASIQCWYARHILFGENTVDAGSRNGEAQRAFLRSPKPALGMAAQTYSRHVFGSDRHYRQTME